MESSSESVLIYSASSISDVSSCVSQSEGLEQFPYKALKGNDGEIQRINAKINNSCCEGLGAPVKKKLKRWTSEEDSMLIEQFCLIGNNWQQIAEKLPGRAVSAVKNRFYCLYNSNLPTKTMQKIKNACLVKKMYKSHENSSELARKINSYLLEESIFQDFLELEKTEPYNHIVHKLNLTSQSLESLMSIQTLMDKAQSLSKSCQSAMEHLESLGKK